MPAPVTRARARTAAVINQFVTPGAGSLICGRWIAGAGQLVTACFGCGLILVWFARQMSSYYGLMFSDQPAAVANPKVFFTGVLIFAVSWFWSGITSLQLLRTASDVNALKVAPALKLDAAAVALALAQVPKWKQDGQVISRTFEFKDFPGAIRFVNGVAQVAEAAWHHPDIDVRWNKVTLALTTHDAGGLTQRDFALAKQFDALSVR